MERIERPWGPGARRAAGAAGDSGVLVAQARATARLWLEVSKTDLIPGGQKKAAKAGK